MTGNTALVECGINTEDSDLRAHVCPIVKRVFVYPTQYGVEAIQSGKYEIKPAYQQACSTQAKIKTAEGYLVPPKDIKAIKVVQVPEPIWVRANFTTNQGESEKGQRAVYVVKWLLKNARFPMYCDPSIVKSMDLQIKGVDIVVNMNTKIQVKCDYRGGPKAYGGTGNLYLQIRECNPFGKY